MQTPNHIIVYQSPEEFKQYFPNTPDNLLRQDQSNLWGITVNSQNQIIDEKLDLMEGLRKRLIIALLEQAVNTHQTSELKLVLMNSKQDIYSAMRVRGTLHDGTEIEDFLYRSPTGPFQDLELIAATQYILLKPKGPKKPQTFP